MSNSEGGEVRPLKSPLKISAEKRKWVKGMDYCLASPNKRQRTSSLSEGRRSSSTTGGSSGVDCQVRPPSSSSPEPNCPICLGKIEGKAYAHGCFHTFCKTCLFEWAKVKNECPVCRQSFDKIIYNIKAIDDYDEYLVARTNAASSAASSFASSIFASMGHGHPYHFHAIQPFFQIPFGHSPFVPSFASSMMTMSYPHSVGIGLPEHAPGPRQRISHLLVPRRLRSRVSTTSSITRHQPSSTVTSSSTTSRNSSPGTSYQIGITVSRDIARSANTSSTSSRDEALPSRSTARIRPSRRSVRLTNAIYSPTQPLNEILGLEAVGDESSELQYWNVTSDEESPDAPFPPPKGSSAYRRYIYNYNLWAKYPTSGSSYRMSSAVFYSDNSAQLHRLMPFLNRELNALLSSEFEANSLTHRIFSHLTQVSIRSKRFRKMVENHTLINTDHFIHELYCFATSVHETLSGYDRETEYVPKEETDVKTTLASVPPVGFLYEDDSEDERVLAHGMFTIRDPRNPPWRKRNIEVIDILDSSDEEDSTAQKDPIGLEYLTSRSQSPPPFNARDILPLSPEGDRDQDNNKSESSSNPTSSLQTTEESPALDDSHLNINIIDDFDNPRPGPSGVSHRRNVTITFDKPSATSTSFRPWVSENNHSDDEDIDVGKEGPTRLMIDTRFPITPSRALVSNEDDSDSEDEVLIVGSVKPRHLRTPEIIDLSDSDSEDRKTSKEEANGETTPDSGWEEENADIPLKKSKGKKPLKSKVVVKRGPLEDPVASNDSSTSDNSNSQTSSQGNRKLKSVVFSIKN